MRRTNAIVSVIMAVLFMIHIIWGGLILCGLSAGGSSIYDKLSYLLLLFMIIHIAISVRLTAETLRIQKKAGVSYFRDNKLFWIRRISGLLLMVLLVAHILIFSGSNEAGVYRLNYFGLVRLILMLLMVISLMIHLACNITPLRIALGINDKNNIRMDIALVLLIILMLAAVAFIVYFIRWRNI